MLSIPFTLIGGFWLVYWLGFNMSVVVRGGGQADHAGGA